jgi:hypothetical protein
MLCKLTISIQINELMKGKERVRLRRRTRFVGHFGSVPK